MGKPNALLHPNHKLISFALIECSLHPYIKKRELAVIAEICLVAHKGFHIPLRLSEVWQQQEGADNNDPFSHMCYRVRSPCICCLIKNN